MLSFGVLHLPRGTTELTSVFGGWAREFTVQRERLPVGSFVVEQRGLQTGHVANPFFLANRPGQAWEESGQVYFGALAYSGSWRITAEHLPNGDVRIHGGYNPVRLSPGAGTRPAPCDARLGLRCQRQRLGRRQPAAARLRPPAGAAACAGLGRGAAGPVQQLGSDHVRPELRRPGRAGPQGRGHRHRDVLRGRRLVWRPPHRIRRPGRLGSQPGGLSRWAGPADRRGPSAGHALWHLGRAGDGQSRLRPVPPASRLGAALPRPPALRSPLAAYSGLRATGGSRHHLRRSGPPAEPARHRLYQVGHEPQCLGARIGCRPGNLAPAYRGRVQHHGPAAPSASPSVDRELLGRRRPYRPGDSGPHRPVLDQRQYRRLRPYPHPGGLQPGLPGHGDGGMGHRCAEPPDRSHQLVEICASTWQCAARWASAQT